MQRMQRGLFQRGSFVRKHHRALAVPTGTYFPLRNLQKAPSVAVPESIIPSADAIGDNPSASFQMSDVTRSFCLRVSGAVAPSAPAQRKAGLSRRDGLTGQ
ncbi:hypothetical protein JCM18382A_65620 [Bradyrhizobium sp. 17-4]